MRELTGAMADVSSMFKSCAKTLFGIEEARLDLPRELV